MKRGFQLAVICAFVLAGFVSSASATFGDSMADILCFQGRDVYMHPQDEAVWNHAHEGTYTVPGTTYIFRKLLDAEYGTCYKRVSVVEGYWQARVNKQGNTLKRDRYEKSVQAPGLF